ncbi:MAG: hypothetical protein LBT20_07105, partial [Clostridiales bacterium]|nr:hypothetical protein [Clostridiales bacterium]
CDVKERGTVKEALSLACDMNAAEYIYFTGTAAPEEMADLTAGSAFVNTHFYEKKFPLEKGNLEKIKAYLDGFKNPRLLGINIPYIFADDAFLAEAARIGLKLSIYTVDDREVLERLIERGVYNITTNIVFKVES